ncbi:hypothetical protein MTR_6g034995 [Medicago truncatula]|uniref:Uncharacterized protein n=1 Tax=Medicago truncatula TaxID=3880 RepID=A0A072U7V6_MEDTR|nr:hypothetical protein MTR_6g034995 [Medicago truncatula]
MYSSNTLIINNHHSHATNKTHVKFPPKARNENQRLLNWARSLKRPPCSLKRTSSRSYNKSSLVVRFRFTYYDNVSVVYLSENLIQHKCTKHIEMEIHFVCDKVAKGQVRVFHVSSRYQISDIFTKGLPLQLFDDFRDSLNIREPPVSSTGVY